MSDTQPGPVASLGLLILRLGAGGMMIYGHGLDKLMNFAEKKAGFPDPLGFGTEISLALAVFGEVVCAGAVAIGLLTRLAAIPAATTMGVAAFLYHSADPFKDRELALVYMVMFVAILFTGPGRYSIDAKLFQRDF